MQTKCRSQSAHRLRKHQKAFLCFLENLRVDFDNNLAERDFRMINVQQTASGAWLVLKPLAAFAAMCPHCANQACLCRLYKPLCVVIPSFLHSSGPGQLRLNVVLLLLWKISRRTLPLPHLHVTEAMLQALLSASNDIAPRHQVQGCVG